MSLKLGKFNGGLEICHTCMFIDEYTLNVSDEGEIPVGYDGTSICGIHNDNEEESIDNRLFVSPYWAACKKYKRCTERQAKYLDIFDTETQTIIKNPNDISKIKQ